MIVALGSVLGTIEDVVDELREQGVKIGVVGIKCFRPYPLDEVREALGHAAAWWWWRRRSPWASAGSSARTCGSRCPGCPPTVYDVVAGLGGRPITKVLAAPAAGGRPRGPARAPDLPRPGLEIVERELRAPAGEAPVGPARREHAAGHRDRGAPGPTRRVNVPASRSSSTKRAASWSGNRLLDRRRSAPCRRARERSNSLTSGHRACQGCGEALGARYALDAAMRRHRGQADRRQRHRLPRGLLHALPRVVVAAALDPLAVRQRAGRGHRHRRRAEGQGPRPTSAWSARAATAATVDIGFACLSGMFERGDDVLYVCYDNEAYMNTGVQRSGATPPAARTATTKPVGPEPGNVFGQGKNVPLIAMAHEIPYVATATVAELRDLERKVERAMEFRGRALPARLRALPAGLGLGLARHDPRSPAWSRRPGCSRSSRPSTARSWASRRSGGGCRSRST